MRILQVCAELFPLLKTGGLADVTGALPPALRRAGLDVRVLLPGFEPILAGLGGLRTCADLPPRAGLPAATLLQGTLPDGGPAYAIDAPALFRRPGGPYEDAAHRPWPDNALRFALLGSVASRLALGHDASWQPELVHAHDWHAGLVPAYLRADAARAACVFTVHNLAYQGLFDAAEFAPLGLPPGFFAPEGLEFHGRLGFMKAGLFFADRLTTVSPSYAREIQQPEQGMGLDGLLRARSGVLEGILNGVDPAVWDPAADRGIAAPYDAGHLAGKAQCKAALQRAMGLAPREDALLFVVVSRLTEQKGLHLLLQALPQLRSLGGQLALLGSGDADLEAAFGAHAAAHPEQIAVRVGYDEGLAHELVAGGDAILVPSRFEPCGLTQLYGLRYGTLPLVHRVGGLADTVVDASLEALDEGRATGFVFERFEAGDLEAALRRAFALRRRPADWLAVQRNAMARRHDWDVAAQAYGQVYQRALAAAH